MMITFESELASMEMDLLATKTSLEMEYEEMCEVIEDDICAARARYVDDILHSLDQAMEHFKKAQSLIVTLERTGGIKY